MISLKDYLKKFSLFLILLIFLFFNFFLKVHSQSQQNQIPICSAPNNLLVVNGTWSSGNFLMTSSTPGVLVPGSLSFSSNNNIINSQSWLSLTKGLILAGPSSNFNYAGALYFRDLNKRSATSGNYNEFIIYMSSSGNNLIFRYLNALQNTSQTALTLTNQGTLSSNNLISFNRISIGTTTLSDKLYLFSNLNSTNTIHLDTDGGGNLKIGTNILGSFLRFKEFLNIYYYNNTYPLLTINNNQKIGINNNNPQYTLDVSGDINSTNRIISNTFCLGNNCITSWPQGGGGLSGAGTANYIPRWTGTYSLGNSIIQQISNNQIEILNGDIIARQFCFKTQNNSLDCLNSWPNRPAVPYFHKYVLGHEYWENFLTTDLINVQQETNVSNQDPYIRPGNTNYDNSIGKGHPYLSLRDIIQRIGFDPNNSFATKWFILGYSYRQPYENVLSALFIEEGDNLNPWKRYSKTPTSTGGLDPNNSNDVFVYCYYQNNSTGAIYGTSDYDYCQSIRNNNRPGYQIINYTYTERNANIRGYVNLEIRLEPARQRLACSKRDYLNSMLLATWGDPRVINLRVNNPRYPNLDNDPCVDNNRRVNMHSLIMGRFIVNPYPTNSITDPRYISSTPISNFNTTSTDFKVVIKSLGVVRYLPY
jgi:hypothetical protein